MKKVQKHLARQNKVGNKHYAFQNIEMYARKVALLQVLKYMPQSVELSTAIESDNAAERGAVNIIDQNFVVVDEESSEQQTSNVTSSEQNIEPETPFD